MYESWEKCAIREVKEEMDVSICKVRTGHVTNDIMKSERKHYVTIFMMAEIRDLAKPKNMEPHKCEGWKSYSWEDLKKIEKKGAPNLFGPLKKILREEPNTIKAYLKKRLHKV